MEAGEKLANLIVRIYELGLDIETWPQMLDEIAAFHGCSKIGYMHIANDDSQRLMGFFRHPEPDAPNVINALDVYHELPPRSDLWFEILNKPGQFWEGPYLCNRYLPPDELVSSDCYNLVVKEVGCFDNLGMRVAAGRDYGSYLSVYSDGPHHMFTEEDAARHAALYPHIRRVVDAQTRFAHAMRLSAVQGSALDMLDFAIIAADADGKIAFANHAARALLLDRSGLEERRGRLAASNGENGALQAALRRACGVGEAPVGGALSIPRTNKSALMLDVLPFDPGLAEDPFQRFAFARLAFIIVTDPAGRRPASRDLLAAYFGLRPSEARVAELLLAGRSQKEIAEALGIGEGTTRWHVKNMLSKLGVRRESELVIKLAAALPPIVAAE